MVGLQLLVFERLAVRSDFGSFVEKGLSDEPLDITSEVLFCGVLNKPAIEAKMRRVSERVRIQCEAKDASQTATYAIDGRTWGPAPDSKYYGPYI